MDSGEQSSLMSTITKGSASNVHWAPSADANSIPEEIRISEFKTPAMTHFLNFSIVDLKLTILPWDWHDNTQNMRMLLF